MSVFVVDAAHIDALLSAAIHGPTDRRRGSHLGWQPPYVHELLDLREPLGADNASAAGRALMEECIASVSYRYPDLIGELPGPMPTPLPEQYEWTDLGRVMTAIEACKAIACFEHQSSEHPGWLRSGVRAFYGEVRKGMVSGMAGYDAAPWEWDVELALARSRTWPPR